MKNTEHVWEFGTGQIVVSPSKKNKSLTVLGMDMPKPDNYPFEIHKLLLSRDIFIMENLTNLESLQNVPSFEVMAFPLNIRAEGSIVRAVARF